MHVFTAYKAQFIIPHFVWPYHNLKTFLVDGGWGEWSVWGPCSVTCGSGIQGRIRLCNNPFPQHGGDDCTVDGSSPHQTRECNELSCPSE